MVAAQAKAAASEFINAARDKAAGEARHRALAAIGTYEAAVPVLVEGLKDPTVGVRARCAWALGLIGPKAKAAVPMLKQAREDESTAVQRAANDALRKIQPDRFGNQRKR